MDKVKKVIAYRDDQAGKNLSSTGAKLTNKNISEFIRSSVHKEARRVIAKAQIKQKGEV